MEKPPSLLTDADCAILRAIGVAPDAFTLATETFFFSNLFSPRNPAHPSG